VNVAPETTVVLVGTALDGPANAPFVLYDNVDPYEALGFSPLAHAYSAARRAGANRIIGYRVNGVHATAIAKDTNGQELFSLRSISANESYNQIHVVLYPDHLFIGGTDGRERNYFFDRYPTVRDLVYGINRDSYYGLLEFTAENINEYASTMNAVSDAMAVNFSGGNSESYLIHDRNPDSLSQTDTAHITSLLKEKLKVVLFGGDAADILERIPNGELATLEYGVIVLVDMFHNDDPEYTEMLGSFCMNKTNEYETGCVGVLGIQPWYTSDNIHQNVLDLVSLTQSLEDKEAYKYVQVIVGDTVHPTTQGIYISTAYAFGAVQSLLPYNTMMSNKQIYGITKLNSEITKEDIALLSSNGYTCIVPSIRKGFVPYYSVSYSKNTTAASSRPHNIRISQHISSAISQEVDSLIGSEYTILSVKNAIGGAKELLNQLLAQGIIKDFTLDYSLADNNTSLSIQVAFTPVSEITAISSAVTITFPREVAF
jgi:hypothetical protein